MSRIITLTDRTITREELTRLAEFAVLWPRELPDGYEHTRIAEMSANETESTGSGVFILEFVKDQEHWISIWQSVEKMKPNLEELTPIGTISLPNSKAAAVYEVGPDRKTAFFNLNGVDIEFNAKGLSIDEIAATVLTLGQRQSSP